MRGFAPPDRPVTAIAPMSGPSLRTLAYIAPFALIALEWALFGLVVAVATVAVLAVAGAGAWWLRGIDVRALLEGLRVSPPQLARVPITIPSILSAPSAGSRWTIVGVGVLTWTIVTTATLATAPEFRGPGGSEAGTTTSEASIATSDSSGTAPRLVSDTEWMAAERPVSVAPVEVAGPPPASSAAPVPTAPAPEPTSLIVTGPRGGPLATSGQDLYNCVDFTSWEQARTVYEASGPGDPNRIDIDGNGIPCEALKAASGG